MSSKKYIRKTHSNLDGQVIDVHSHVGVHAGMYKNLDYPCCQSVEGLYYRQLAGGIDVNVVFPFGSYPDGSFPYEIDNRRLMRDVYEFCPDLSDRFLPFLCLDTANQVDRQMAAARELAGDYPLYGIKTNPIDRQVPVISLRSEGRAILELAEELDLPMLFHSVPRGLDGYSSAEDILDIAEECPRVRFCLAHSLLFCKDLLDRADSLSNVWVDTAALKIQVDVVRQLVEKGSLDRDRLIRADLNDHLDVMRKITDAYPDLIIWGSDSPTYTFNTRREQYPGVFSDFHLPGRYEDEVAALRSLARDQIKRVSNTNTLKFLFGKR